MIHNLATLITEKLIVPKTSDKSFKSIYSYGLELIISSIFGILLITILGITLFDFLHVLTFLTVFITMRSFCGGYHANSYMTCNLISVTSFLVSAIFANYLKLTLFSLTSITLFCIITLLLICPVNNPNKQIEATSYLKLKIASLMICSVFLMVSIAFYMFDIVYGANIQYTLLIVTILSILGHKKHLKRKEY